MISTFDRVTRASLLGLVLASLASPLVLGINYVEDFEDDTVGTLPTDNFYTLSGTGSRIVANDQSLTSVNSFKFALDPAATNSNARFNMDPGNGASIDLCEAGSEGSSIGFAFRASGWPTGGGNTYSFELYESGASVELGLSVDTAGVFTFTVNGAGLVVPGVALVTNQWHDIRFNGIDCATAQATVVFVQEGIGFTNNAPGSITSMDEFFVNFGSLTDPRSIWLDDFRVFGVADPPPVSASAMASVAVTNLVGFDVSPDGSALIARTDAGATIESYNPVGSGSLSQRGSDLPTDCTDNDMVAATDVGATLMVVCDAGTNLPKFFSIRDLTLGVYDFPGDCSPSSDCLDDINFLDDCTFDDEATIGELDDIEFIPLDYSYVTDSNFLVDDSRAVAIAYSTNNGYVGVFEYTTVDNSQDECNEERQGFAGSEAEQISVWQKPGTTDRQWIAAVDSGGLSKLFEYQPALVSVGTSLELDGTLSSGVSIGGITGGVAISCADYYCLIGTNAASNNLHYVDVRTGSDEPGFPRTAVGTILNRGVFLDPLRNFFSYTTSTAMYIGYVNNGTVFGSLAYTGTFYEQRATANFTGMWLATTARIFYYDGTTSFPDQITGGCITCTPTITPTATTSLFAGQGALIGASLGIGSFGGNLFAGSILVAMVAFGVGTATRNMTFALLGAVLGFLLAWGFGFFSAGVVFSVVILAGAVLYFFRGRGGG